MFTHPLDAGSKSPSEDALGLGVFFFLLAPPLLLPLASLWGTLDGEDVEESLDGGGSPACSFVSPFLNSFVSGFTSTLSTLSSLSTGRHGCSIVTSLLSLSGSPPSLVAEISSFAFAKMSSLSFEGEEGS